MVSMKLYLSQCCCIVHREHFGNYKSPNRYELLLTCTEVLQYFLVPSCMGPYVNMYSTDAILQMELRSVVT